MIILAVTIQTLSSRFLSSALITAQQSDHKLMSKSLMLILQQRGKAINLGICI